MTQIGPDGADLAGLAKTVDEVVDRFLEELPLPGLAFGIVADGRLVVSGGRGERGGRDRARAVPDADTVFRIASMTKSFTATAVLQLRDEGALSLDDPVAAHLPEVRGMGLPTGDSAPLTVRQLLTMSAGLPTDDPWGDRQQSLPVEQFAQLVGGGLRFAWPNGGAFEYSNLGYALLGRLVAVLREQDYGNALTASVLAPLGLASTVFTAEQAPPDRLATGHQRIDGQWVELPFDGYGAFAPMGGLFSTVRDLSRWVGGFTDAFPARDDPPSDLATTSHPLRRASRRELQQPHRTMPDPPAWTRLDVLPTPRVGSYGFGLCIESDPRLGEVIWHSGGYPGFGSNMRWHPDTGIGVVVLANATYAPAARLASQLLTRLLADRPAPEAARARAGLGLPWPAEFAALPGLRQAPRSGTLWPETRAARDDVERLVESWDDALADRLFAMNVDLDDPLPRRRSQLESLSSRLGPFVRDDDAPMLSDAPPHLSWWLRGPGGRLRLEIRLTPQLPPKVQTLTVTGAANPSPAVRSAAQALVAAICSGAADSGETGSGESGSGEPGSGESDSGESDSEKTGSGATDSRTPGSGAADWPAELAAAPGADRSGIVQQLRVAAAWAGGVRLGDVVAGDGGRESTFRLEGGRLALTLLVRVDQRGAVAHAVLRPAD